MSERKVFVTASWLAILFPIILLFGKTKPEIAMDAIAILFLLRSFLAKDWNWCKRIWIKCLALLWAYMMLRSLFVVDNIKDSFAHSIVFARYFVFSSALGYWILPDSKNRQRFIWVLTAALLFMLTDGIYQHFRGIDLFGDACLYLSSICKVDLKNFYTFVQPGGNLRLGGSFQKPILGIMFAWLSFPIVLYYLCKDKKIFSLQSAFAGLFALSILAIVAISGERLAMLLMLLGWVISIALMSGYRLKFITVFAVALAALAVVALTHPMVLERQAKSTIDTVAYNFWDSPYGKLLTSNLRLAEINPIFGLGAYQFRSECPKLYPQMNEDQLKLVCNIHPHNIYLEWLIEQGIIGLGLFLAFLTIMFKNIVTHFKTLRNNPIFIGFVIAFILRVWPIASTTGFFSRWGASPFWLVVGWLIFYFNQEKYKISCNVDNSNKSRSGD